MYVRTQPAWTSFALNIKDTIVFLNRFYGSMLETIISDLEKPRSVRPVTALFH